jgi:hypothetical protein
MLSLYSYCQLIPYSICSGELVPLLDCRKAVGSYRTIFQYSLFDCSEIILICPPKLKGSASFQSICLSFDSSMDSELAIETESCLLMRLSPMI